jgi:hypothetical protein
LPSGAGENARKTQSLFHHSPPHPLGRRRKSPNWNWRHANILTVNHADIDTPQSIDKYFSSENKFLSFKLRRMEVKKQRVNFKILKSKCE